MKLIFRFIMHWTLAFGIVTGISIGLKAQPTDDLCFKTEAEYNQLLASKKLPKIFQSMPIYLTGESAIKGKAVINIYFSEGLIKFYVSAATLKGNFKIAVANENRIKLCVSDLKVNVQFTTGQPQQATLISDSKINVQGLELNVANKKDYDKLHLIVNDLIVQRDSGSKAQSSGVEQ